MIADGTGDVTEPGPVEELTTRTSNTRRQADGSLTLESYNVPVNYRDDSGQWRRINTDLVPVAGPTYEAQNAANDFAAQIPSNAATTPLRFERDNDWVTMRMHGLEGAPVVDATQATFENVKDADEVTYESTATGIKESIVLANAPAAPVEFVYSIDSSASLTPILTAAGEVEFRRPNGAVKVAIPVGNMVDSATPEKASTEAVSYDLRQSGLKWTLTVTPDHTWLSDPARVYPVVVDPSLTTPASADCWLEQELPNNSYCGDFAPYIRTGRKAPGAGARGLINFNVSAIPANATVSAASASLYLDSSKSYSNTPADYSFYAAGKSWGQGASWNSSGTSGLWATLAGDPGPTTYGTLALSGTTTSGYRTFTGLKPIVQGWVNGTVPKRGLVLKQSANFSNNVLYFHSSSAAAANNGKRPYLTVTYTVPPGPDLVVEEILSYAPGFTAAQVTAEIDELVASSQSDPEFTPVTFDQAKNLILQDLKNAAAVDYTQLPELPATPEEPVVATEACEWEVIPASDGTVTVAHDGAVEQFAPAAGDDSKSPVFEGQVNGSAVSVQLWEGTARTEIDELLSGAEASLDGLGDASIANAVDGDQEEEVSETFTSNSPPLVMETVAYRLEAEGAVESGVPDDVVASQASIAGDSATIPASECVRVPAADDTGFTLSTDQGRVTIPSGPQLAVAEQQDYPPTTTAVRYRTFIPGATANTYWLCGTFKGDDRTFSSYYSLGSRTRASMFFNWPDGTLDTTKSVGATHRLKGYKRSAKTRTASSKGIKFTSSVMSKDYGRITISHAVGNPLCSWGGDISYYAVVEVWKDGTARLTGKRVKVPAHEAYVYPESWQYGKELFRGKARFFMCLSVNCGTEMLDETFTWRPSS